MVIQQLHFRVLFPFLEVFCRRKRIYNHFKVVETYSIDIQTSEELIQMDVKKMMTNRLFTKNDKHTQSENKHNKSFNQANHALNILESLINLIVFVKILLFTVKYKISFKQNRAHRVKGTIEGLQSCDFKPSNTSCSHDRRSTTA